jgi:hypothetical protein
MQLLKRYGFFSRQRSFRQVLFEFLLVRAKSR